MMLEFIEREKGALDHYAHQTWQVMSGRYALTEMNGLSYHISVSPKQVEVTPLEGNGKSFTIPTVKFKAFLEMFRI